MRVSVIIAAYNSSARLICAVESVRRQTMQDFEIVVVGDGATDDSEELLAALGDERVRWENLPTNWGEQSVPSNRGIELARGHNIFFLNQDDLWRPDHLSTCLEVLETEGADVVWSPYLVLPPGFRPDMRDTPGIQLLGISPMHPQFYSDVFIPGSCTAWRRGALDTIGGWRTAGEVTISPSQDLLWRAKRAGLKIVGTDRPTVLVLWSGARQGSYKASYRPEDNVAWLDALTTTPWLVDQEIARASVSTIATLIGQPPLRRLPRWSAKWLIARFCALFGIHPQVPIAKIRYSRKGGFINFIRAMNDLESRDFTSDTKSKHL